MSTFNLFNSIGLLCSKHLRCGSTHNYLGRERRMLLSAGLWSMSKPC